MKTASLLAFAAFLSLAGCASIPDGVPAVQGLDVQRYMGTWYEIARLDHRFERGLDNVSAAYSPREDGGINVRNRGYDADKGEWKEANGRAYPVGGAGEGRLKVTFFWPFYGGYNVIALDHDAYAYAMVCGPDRSYLWILARETTLPQPALNSLLDKARELGFATGDLIFVKHDNAGGGS